MKNEINAKNSSLRQQAEELLKSRRPDLNKESAEHDILKLIYEMDVNQIELKLQNEELQRAKVQAEIDAAKYADLYDFAPSGYFTLSQKAEILELNHSGAKMLGMNRSLLQNKSFSSFISNESKPVFNLFLERAFNSKMKEACNVALINKGGLKLHVALTAIYDEKMDNFRLTVVDVSELFNSNDKLFQSERRFRDFAENSSVLIYRLLLKPEFRFEYVSPSATAITGYSPEDHYADPQLGFKLVHADDRKLLEDTAKHSSGEPLVLRWIKKDGSVIWTEQRNVLLFDQNNEPFAIEGQARDITETKNAEAALQKDVQRNTLLLELFAQAPVLTDKELYDQALDIAVKITESEIGFFHQVSDDQQEIILTTWNNEAKKNCSTVYTSHYPLEQAGNWADCVRQKKAVVYNDFQLSLNKKGLPEGHAPLNRFMSIPVIQDDKVRLIFGVGNKAIDYSPLDVIQLQSVANELFKILEKRNIEQILRKTEDRWLFAIEGSNDGIWDWNLLTDEVYFSNRWKEMIGYKTNEINGNLSEWKNRVHPDDLPFVMEALQQHLNGEIFQYVTEHRIHCKDGSWKWITDRGKVLEWTAEGKPARMVGTHADITSRKLMEETLQLSEKRYRTTLESISDAFFTLDNDLRFTYFNKKAEALLLKKSDEVLGKQIFSEVFREAKGSVFEENYTYSLSTKQVSAFETFFGIKPLINWYDVRVYPGPEGISVFFTIISDRKEAEKVIMEDQKTFHILNDLMSDYIFKLSAQPEGDFLMSVIAGNYTQATGHSVQEMNTPSDWYKIIHPDDLHILDSNFKQVIEQKKPVNFNCRSYAADGTLRWLEVIASPDLDNGTQKVNEIFGSVRNITERKLAEDKLKESEVQYRNLANAGAALIWMSGKDKLCNYFNTPWLKFTGRTLDQEKGNGWTEGVHPDDTDACFETYVTAFDKHEAFEMEYRLRHVSGEYRWIMDIGTPNFDSTGEFVGCIGHCFDITERRLVEDTQTFMLSSGLLGTGEDFFESLARYLAQTLNMEYVCIDRLEGDGLTAQTVAIYNEGKFESNVRYALRDTPCGEVVDKSICCYSKNVRQHFPNDLALQDLNAESYVGTTLLDSKGKAIGLIAVIGHQPLYNERRAEVLLRIVSLRAAGELERRDAENTLKETLEQLNKANLHLEERVEERTREILKLSGLQKAILDNAPLAIMTTTVDGVFQSINPSGEQMLGYSKAELVGKYTPLNLHDKDELIHFYTDTCGKEDPTDENIFANALQHMHHKTTEWNWIRKNGEKFPVRISHSSVVDSDGVLQGYMGLIEDISQEKKAYDALRQSEAINRAILSSVPDLMFRLDKNGVFLDSHTGTQDGLYILPDEFIGREIEEVLPPQVASLAINALEQAFLKPETITFEYELAINDESRYFEDRVLTINENEALSIIRDITDRKQAEDQWQKTMQKLTILIQNLQAGTLFENEHRQITLVNQSFCNLFNISATPEQLIGFDCVVAGESSKNLMKDPDGFIKRIDDILSANKIVVNDELFLLDGRVFERDYIPILNNNLLLGHLWQYRDITQRKESETALKMQIAAFESFALTIIITDINGRIQWVNSAFTLLSGYSGDEVIGKTPGELVNSGKQDNDFYKTFWETILSKKVWSGELINRRKDGSLYHEEETITPVLDSEGNISNFIAIKIDISDRKKAEDELKLARAQAEKANIAKSEFLSRMSHELRTPMNSILGFAQLMQMSDLKPAQSKGVNHILNSGTHLLNLINEVLDVSKIDAGQMALSPETVDIRSVINEMIDIVRPDAVKRNMNVESEQTSDAPVYATADRQRLKQALLNLIGNAVKYNREGGSVRIKAEFREGVASGEKVVRILVRDTGYGISDANIEKLFIPFERIGAEKTGTEGTGLGLSITKKLIEAMHGTVGVESKPGEGSTFWIELPHAENDRIRETHTSDNIEQQRITTVKTGTIVYAEDNISNAELVLAILENHRPAIHLITSKYGLQAINIAIEKKPDLILLDLDLPDMHGSKVMEILQANTVTRNIPVVVISADAMPGQIDNLLKAGARDYLTKPIDIEVFLRVVDEWLGIGQPETM
jgi:PAS domain S-box-containing protein